uniref:Secreted protein n=1 Tax=Angiostrongylus cantonensis TaxID=6313 RepID=A0A0K0D640_ANGCA
LKVSFRRKTQQIFLLATISTSLQNSAIRSVSSTAVETRIVSNRRRIVRIFVV